MDRFLAVVAIAAIIGGFVPMQEAVAQPQEATREQIVRAEILMAEAKAKYHAGDFEGAAALFKRAYELSGVLGTLFNLARSKAEAGHLSEAKQLFLLFKKKVQQRRKKPTDEDVKAMLAADQEVAKIDQKLAELAKARQSSGAGPKVILPAEATVAQLPAAQTEISDSGASPQPTRTFSATRLNNWRSYVAAGLVIGGVGAMFVGRSLGEEANARAPITTLNEKEAYKADYSTASTTWWAGLAATVAGAGLATWAAFDAYELKVIPIANHRGAGLAITGRF